MRPEISRAELLYKPIQSKINRRQIPETVPTVVTGVFSQKKMAWVIEDPHC